MCICLHFNKNSESGVETFSPAVTMLQALLIALLISPTFTDDPTEFDCEGTPTDVIFILDASNSIWGPDFGRQLTFVGQVIRRFRISDDFMKVGIITFSDTPVAQFHLKEYNKKHALKKAVQGIKQDGGVLTRTDLALEFMRNVSLSPENGAREGVTRIAIVITDGQSTNKTATQIAAKRAKEEGIHIFAIGVGYFFDIHELYNMASRPRSNYVFRAQNYLSLRHLKDILAIKACTVTDPPTTPPPTTTPLTTTTMAPTTSSLKIVFLTADPSSQHNIPDSNHLIPDQESKYAEFRSPEIENDFILDKDGNPRRVDIDGNGRNVEKSNMNGDYNPYDLDIDDKLAKNGSSGTGDNNGIGTGVDGKDVDNDNSRNKNKRGHSGNKGNDGNQEILFEIASEGDHLFPQFKTHDGEGTILSHRKLDDDIDSNDNEGSDNDGGDNGINGNNELDSNSKGGDNDNNDRKGNRQEETPNAHNRNRNGGQFGPRGDASIGDYDDLDYYYYYDYDNGDNDDSGGKDRNRHRNNRNRHGKNNKREGHTDQNPNSRRNGDGGHYNSRNGRNRNRSNKNDPYWQRRGTDQKGGGRRGDGDLDGPNEVWKGHGDRGNEHNRHGSGRDRDNGGYDYHNNRNIFNRIFPDGQDASCHLGDPTDIVFVIDEKTGGSSTNRNIWKFIRDMVKNLNVDGNKVRVKFVQGCEQFGGMHLGGRNKSVLINAIDSMKLQPKKTADLLRQMTEVLNKTRGSSPESRRSLGIYLTDGQSGDLHSTLKEAQNAKHIHGMELFGIGIGKEPDTTELRALVSCDVEDHLFLVPHSKHLSHIKNFLVEEICKDS